MANHTAALKPATAGEPFTQKTSDIYSSLRTVQADWVILLHVAGYTFLVSSFLYCVSVLLIRRRSLA